MVAPTWRTLLRSLGSDWRLKMGCSFNQGFCHWSVLSAHAEARLLNTLISPFSFFSRTHLINELPYACWTKISAINRHDSPMSFGNLSLSPIAIDLENVT